MWRSIQYGFVLYSTSSTQALKKLTQSSFLFSHKGDHRQHLSSNPSSHILDQFNEFKINNNLDRENIFFINIQQPTGLFFAHNPSILVPEVIDSFKDIMAVDLNQFMLDHVCILQHNCVEINHLYKGVYQIPKVLSKNQCLEIILKAEELASQHGGCITFLNWLVL